MVERMAFLLVEKLVEKKLDEKWVVYLVVRMVEKLVVYLVVRMAEKLVEKMVVRMVQR